MVKTWAGRLLTGYVTGQAVWPFLSLVICKIEVKNKLYTSDFKWIKPWEIAYIELRPVVYIQILTFNYDIILSKDHCFDISCCKYCINSGFKT